MSVITKDYRGGLSLLWQLCLALGLGASVLMLPDLAFATSPAATNTPIGNIFCTISDLATGNTGKGLATIAITIIGLGALLGKVSWGMALIVALGIALIFGAAQIVGSLGVSNMESGCITSAVWPTR
jgi:type IV secretion system protein VirB2